MYDLTKLFQDQKSVGNLSVATINKRHKELEGVLGKAASELEKLPSFDGSVTVSRKTPAGS